VLGDLCLFDLIVRLRPVEFANNLVGMLKSARRHVFLFLFLFDASIMALAKELVSFEERRW
jgi:hypothetical protein